MAYPHIAHDVVIGDHVIMTTRVTLGGHVHIHDYANIGQGTQIHPYCRIGKYAMVGMGSSITKDVPPFALMNRQRFTKINRIGLERNHVPREAIARHRCLLQGRTRSGPDAWYKERDRVVPKGFGQDALWARLWLAYGRRTRSHHDGVVTHIDKQGGSMRRIGPGKKICTTIPYGRVLVDWCRGFKLD